MVRLIHLAPDRLARRIARTGIKPTRLEPGFGASWLADHDRAVWAFPVLPSHTLSHQWLRELKRRCRSPRTMVAVTFRIADEEPVYVRHFSEAPTRMTAAQAVGAILRHASPLGYEIMVPRRIEAREIVRIGMPPQTIGWRTNTARQRFVCDCRVCIPPGLPRSSRRRARAARLLGQGLAGA
jgi:hypothetical protein